MILDMNDLDLPKMKSKKSKKPLICLIQTGKLFELIAVVRSGAIDPKELKAAMQSLGFEAKNQTIFQMISDLDKNQSGNIDFE